MKSPGDILTPVHHVILNGGERDFLWAGVREEAWAEGWQGAADTMVSSRDRSGATREARRANSEGDDSWIPTGKKPARTGQEVGGGQQVGGQQVGVAHSLLLDFLGK